MPLLSSISALIARQLRAPSGLLGHLVARGMNSANRAMNEAAVATLDARPSDAVLEIGFGGGSALSLLMDRTRHGSVTGLDLSRTMVTRAAGLMRARRGAGSLRLVRGSAAALPFAGASFHRALTVNTIYFWDDPAAVMRGIARILVPGGRCVIGYSSRAEMAAIPPARHGFKLYEPADVEGLLVDGGFADPRSDEVTSVKWPFVLTRATVPESGA